MTLRASLALSALALPRTLALLNLLGRLFQRPTGLVKQKRVAQGRFATLRDPLLFVQEGLPLLE
ncbi:hypothetical protein A9Q02_04500 [Candidatus Chloroploca asiatica]|uniref:Uncharacterized protein n=1 Tax=Candidatus Chloroploca asiatica TaxID=1506545 RepID=A0A2H3KHD2_9CHLR|nr:hypothetical protein A9Q02_04500 [Candidatus Chloroploca asiatica]